MTNFSNAVLAVSLLSGTLLQAQTKYKPGELLVQLTPNTPHLKWIRKVEAEQQMGVKEVRPLSETAGMYHLILRDSTAYLPVCIRKLYRYPEVVNVQKNHLITSRESIPSDVLFDQQWFHKNTGQTGGSVDADIDTPEAWSLTTGGVTAHGDTIVVCIIENGGVDINHVDLRENCWKNHAEIPRDGIDNDNNGYIDDYSGWNLSTATDTIYPGRHGTQVVGMIGAKGNNAIGTSGVSQNVKMMVVQGKSTATEADVLAAYNYPLIMRKKYNETYGEEGAFVVATNASWGLDRGNPSDAPLWCAMYDTLGAYGILNIVATSNSSLNVDVVGDLPATCPSDHLISVTSSNHQDLHARGYGAVHIDLAAPGENVLLPTPGDQYSANSGTSFAAPSVTGAVALAYASPCTDFMDEVKGEPEQAALRMKTYLLDATDPVPGLSGEVATGGRLNAYRTIRSIIGDCADSSCPSPYSLRLVSLTDTSVTMRWNGFSDNYLLTVKTDTQSTVIPVEGQQSISISSLSPCSHYTFSVSALCGTDTSVISRTVSLTTDGCCTQPPLSLTSSSTDSLTLSWANVRYATSYSLRYRREEAPNWTATQTDVSSPLSLGNLASCTPYEFEIKTQCGDSTRGFGTAHLFSTKGCGACYEAMYCTVPISKANTTQEWLDAIAVNQRQRLTGNNGGWYQSEEILDTLTPGVAYPVKLTPGYSGFHFTERFSLWIDTDQNGLFEDAEKLIADREAKGALETTIVLPAGSTQGITRMRIGMVGPSLPKSCPVATFQGEYEDYCVYIGDRTADGAAAQEKNAAVLFPNPAQTTVHIKTDAPVQAVVIFSLDGKEVYRGGSDGDAIAIRHLVPGLYNVQITTQEDTYIQKLIVH